MCVYDGEGEGVCVCYKGTKRCVSYLYLPFTFSTSLLTFAHGLKLILFLFYCSFLTFFPPFSSNLFLYSFLHHFFSFSLWQMRKEMELKKLNATASSDAVTRKKIRFEEEEEENKKEDVLPEP